MQILSQYPSRRGNALIMSLVLISTFSLICLTMTELTEAQSRAIEYQMAEVQLEYVSYSGLSHGQQRLTEDSTQALTDGEVLLDEFTRNWCVEWLVTDGGLKVCNTSPSKRNDYCCIPTYTRGSCPRPPVAGVCTDPGKWQARYNARYDSIQKTIISTASVLFVNDDPDTQIIGDPVRFQKSRQMSVNWE